MGIIQTKNNKKIEMNITDSKKNQQKNQMQDESNVSLDDID